MIRSMVRKWVRFSLAHPFLVMLAATVVAGVLGDQAVSRFAIRSDLGDLLPEARRSVVDHRWVQAHAGAPEVIEPIIKVTEPQADRLEVKDGEHDGLAQDVARVERGEGAGELKIRLREPLLPKDGPAGELRLLVKRRPQRGDPPEIVAQAVQKGAELSLSVSSPQGAELEALAEEIRAGDPNGDGVFAMEVAKEGLAVIAEEISKSEDIEFVLHRLDLDYFDRNALLFADGEDLKKLKCCIRWKKEEAVKKEIGLGGEGGDDAEEEEEEEEDDDPFAPTSALEADPDCKERELNDETCSFEGRGKGGGTVLPTIPEYFVSYEGYLAMFLKPSISSTDLAANKRTQQVVRDIYAKVLAENQEEFGWAFELETLQLGGGYVSRYEEVNHLKGDLFSTVGITVTLLALVLLTYFRTARSLVLVLVPLAYGVVSSLGITFMTVGYLNLITVFIFAVLFGLGIDYGIHFLHRYIEERAAGQSQADALEHTLASTGLATTMSCLTTAATFMVLMLTSSRAFTQFGFIASVGVPLCLVYLFVLFPALTAIWARIHKGSFERRSSVSTSRAVPYIKRLLSRRGAVRIAVFGVLLAAASVLLLDRVEFEYDTRNIRALNPKMDAVVKNKSGSTEGLMLSPSIALGKDREHAARIYQTLRRARADRERFDSLDQVIGLSSLIPEEQEPKLKVISEVRQILRKKRDFVDDPEDRRRLDDLYEHTDVKEVGLADVPESLLRFFREKPRPIVADVDLFHPGEALKGLVHWLAHSEDRRVGTFVYVFPGKSMWNIRNAIEYKAQMDTLTVDGEPLVISSSHFVLADLVEVIRDDGAWAVTLAFFAVFALVLLDFAFLTRSRFRYLLILLTLPLPPAVVILESAGVLGQTTGTTVFLSGAALVLLAVYLIERRTLRHTAIVLSPLALSFMLLVAGMPLLGWRITFFNMVVFPIILGIGVDSGIHIYHRTLEEGIEALPAIARYTGSAIVMATLTTGIGFGGMLGANHLGLQGVGKLAIFGLSLTLVSAVVFLPAFLRTLTMIGWAPRRLGGDRPETTE